MPIVVYPSDSIFIRAEGCVQTGGSGRTWKRYVNPSGSDSDRLYHGQIQIPGVIESLTFLSDLIGNGSWSRRFIVSSGNTFPGFIAIGYTDDDYDDNGYYSHDDGTENQCRENIDAYLDIYVCRANPVNGPTC